MSSKVLTGKTLTFKTPSGFTFTIREQNGEDDDILSNEADARDLSNLLKLIVAITLEQDFYNGTLTPSVVAKLPSNDLYYIMLRSRIHSIGQTIDFEHKWEDLKDPVPYEEDLSILFFNDYSSLPSEEELAEKPFAIPYYPNASEGISSLGITLSTGKSFKFDLLTAGKEAEYLMMAESERSKNVGLLLRNLYYFVDDNWVRVENFKLFSSSEMAELRKKVMSLDPQFTGNIIVPHPKRKDVSILVNVIGLPNFFYQGGA